MYSSRNEDIRGYFVSNVIWDLKEEEKTLLSRHIDRFVYFVFLTKDGLIIFI